MEQFQAEILICATAYVKARGAEEAHRLIAEAYGTARDPGEIIVKNIPGGANGVSLSPAMTTYGLWTDWTVERAGHGNQHGLRCPTCGSSHDIAVRAEIWTSLDEAGSDRNGDTLDHERSWGEDSPARCMQCHWAGAVADLKTARERTTVYVLVMHEDEEIRSIRVFATRAEAVACRHAMVNEHWSEWLGNEEMPDDPEAAFQRFDEEAGIEGLCIRLQEVEMVACP
jgi:hypothetical protein